MSTPIIDDFAVSTLNDDVNSIYIPEVPDAIVNSSSEEEEIEHANRNFSDSKHNETGANLPTRTSSYGLPINSPIKLNIDNRSQRNSSLFSLHTDPELNILNSQNSHTQIFIQDILLTKQLR